jgi:hypothetical protein
MIMKESSVARTQLIVALVLLAGAGAIFWSTRDVGSGVAEKDFFYDLSERKLFVASRDHLPPIRGLNDDVADAVRAVVVSDTGKPRDKGSHRIAYLEMYSPEWKQQVERARQTGEPPALGRSEAAWHRLVRRVDEETWHRMASAEGERIVTEWATPGPGGIVPVICSP